MNLNELTEEFERLNPIYKKNMEENKNKTFEIKYKSESENSGNCPVCNEHYWNSCRCYLLDRSCINGHEWHYDLKTREVHLGPANHNSPCCNLASKD